MNINCQPPLQFVYFSTDTHIPWISHNTLRDRLFKNGVAIRKKVYYSEFQNLFLRVLNIHAPSKVKYVRANEVPYMTNTLRKAIMTRSRLENKYRKTKSLEHKETLKNIKTTVIGYIRENEKNIMKV